MKEMCVKRYEKSFHDAWNGFVESAKNGHFFFYREYMEYHENRFQDCSLIAYAEKERIIAVFPASIHGTKIVSHGGLTFGGFVTNDKMTVSDMITLFEAMKSFYKEQGVTRLLYKCIPNIYTKYPAEEDRYALFVNDAKLIRRDVSSTIYLSKRYKYQERRRRMVNKAKKNRIEVKESHDYISFIKLLNEVLQNRHATSAVHTADEILLLANRFPENIRLYVGELDGKLLAGTILFINRDVVHTQYMANSDKGRDLGALDCVLDYLITKKYADYKYFDFGISNENQGRYLNKGLIGQKEGFGARAVVHDFYELIL